MPNRIIKESICISASIDLLSDKAENLFYRLIVNCDDYGRIDGRPIIIQTKCYPLRMQQITLPILVDLLIELANEKHDNNQLKITAKINQIKNKTPKQMQPYKPPTLMKLIAFWLNMLMKLIH